MTEIIRDNYTVEIEEAELYVDNEARNRSGHMSHAMAEFAPGCFIDFNSNCSAVRTCGHQPYGWIEYRISRDCGKTYSDVYDLPYSKDSFYDGLHSISVEKAVATDDGVIVAFCLRNCAMDASFCEPWATPTLVRSVDGGKTWSEPFEWCPYAGRVYDALYYKGAIYVMIFCNENHVGTLPEHKYRIYKSTDNAMSFEELCVIPFDTLNRAYGSILFDSDDVLHAYAYNIKKEEMMDHAVSRDFGITWEVMEPCYMAQGIRNQQTALIDGVYVVHGRTGGEINARGFVFYTSEDGTNWDEGTIIENCPRPYYGYYSNNLNLCDEKGNFLLIQYSRVYGKEAQVNVFHRKLRIKKKQEKRLRRTAYGGSAEQYRFS